MPKLLSNATREAIRSAPATERAVDVAARLGCERVSVLRYRAEARAQAEEVSRLKRAEYTEAHVTDALADLAELRVSAAEEFRAKRGTDAGIAWGRLWRAAIHEELAQVGPDTWTDAELQERLDAMEEEE
jgi:hypothetical protein